MSNAIGTADSGGGDSGGGDSGGGGIVAVGGAASGFWRPIGVSPALAYEQNETWWRGHKWPPIHPAPPANPGDPPNPAHTVWPNMPTKTAFRREAWTAFHYSLVVLAEFVGHAPKNDGDPDPWHKALNTDDPFAGTDNPSNDALDKSDHYKALLARKGSGANPAQRRENALAVELQELVDLVEYRPGVLAEALEQRNDIGSYFRGVLSFTRASHRATFELMQAALTVGQFQAMHFKAIFKRARPSNLSPSILPPIDPPGHPSYPSGHATEAYLMALCLEHVLPTQIGQPAEEDRPLRRMADRIARNREVLGMHYRSDSEVGEKLAENSFEILKRCKSLDPNDAESLVAKARSEWGR